VAQISTWQACDVGAATGAGYDARSISARPLLMPGRTDLSFPPEDSEAELALLRHARPPTLVTTPAAGTTAHLLIAVADDQCVEPALSVAAGDSQPPSCVTLVVRRLRTHAGHPKSCDHIS
jgi:hypothetical protein